MWEGRNPPVQSLTPRPLCRPPIVVSSEVCRLLGGSESDVVGWWSSEITYLIHTFSMAPIDRQYNV